MATLLLALASCMRAVPPEVIPPRLLYFEPNHADTLYLGQDESQRFELHVQAGEDAVHSAWLNGDEQGMENLSYLFSPQDHGLVWPVLRHDSLLDVRLRVQDGGALLEKHWPVIVSVTPGLEFEYLPEDFEFNATVNDTIDFWIGVRNVEPPISFVFRLDGSYASADSTYRYIPREEGEHQVYAKVHKQGQLLGEFYWEVLVEPCADQTPPLGVADLRIGPGPQPGDLAVAFTPPEDEGLYRYEIRTWHLPLDPAQWASTDLVGLPEATEGVLEERFNFSGQAVGHHVYLRLRVYDICGNRSPWSELVDGKTAGHPVSGQVIDWESGTGIEGLEVRYGIPTPQDMEVDSTDAGGYFRCANVPTVNETGFENGRIRDESTSAVGLWYDLIDTRAVDDSLHYSFGTFQSGPTSTGVYSEFIEYFRDIMPVWTPAAAGGSEVVLHIAYPVAVYLQDFVNNGIDYPALARNAMAIWEEDCGLDLFTEVASPEAAALTIVYNTGGEGNSHYELLDPSAPGIGVPLRGRIHWIANGQPGSEPTLQRVILHELGHAVGPWSHSLEPNHVMAVTNVVDRLSADEIKLMRILYHMSTWQNFDEVKAE